MIFTLIRHVRPLLAALALLLIIPTAASAQRKVLANETFEVAQGQPCAVDAFNGESVWVGNELVVVNGTETIVTPGVEDAPNIDTAVLFWAQDDTIDVFVQGDTFSSLEFSVDCASSTTTTAPEPTTTTEPEPETTTSFGDCAVGRNAQPEDCETTTTTEPEPEPTTTTTPEPDPTTTTTTPDPCAEPGSCLPETGAETPLIMAFGMLSVVLGAIVLVAKRLA